MKKNKYTYERRRVSIDCSKDGRTKQSFRDECDINLIMARFLKTGQLSHLNKSSPRYGDSSSDFNARMNVITSAKSSYEDLPSSVRDNFDGPEDFYHFVSDPKNSQEIFDMGLSELVSIDPVVESSIEKDKKVAEEKPPPSKK